mmetsp:Transcript_53757/g.86896  ORF Transcript_53757/g.86896 Transcript_53757/m.86896 type:complete len:304 (+) Transcript_53757:613-1524(+)
MDVGVDHEVVHAEVLIGILDMLTPVYGRHHPPLAGPSVRDLLVPAIGIKTASPVVVAKHAEPGFVAKVRAVIDGFEDLVELVLCRRMDFLHVGATFCLDASPIEVISNVQDVLGLVQSGPSLERLRNELLWLGVDVVYELTPSWAMEALEAISEVSGIAQERLVILVPAGPGVGMGAWVHVEDVVQFLPIGPLERAVHTAPVANCKDVCGLCHAHVWPCHALVGHSCGWRPHGPEVHLADRGIGSSTHYGTSGLLRALQLQGIQGTVSISGLGTLVACLQVLLPRIRAVGWDCDSRMGRLCRG